MRVEKSTTRSRSSVMEIAPTATSARPSCTASICSLTESTSSHSVRRSRSEATDSQICTE